MTNVNNTFGPYVNLTGIRTNMSGKQCNYVTKFGLAGRVCSVFLFVCLFCFCQRHVILRCRIEQRRQPILVEMTNVNNTFGPYVNLTCIRTNNSITLVEMTNVNNTFGPYVNITGITTNINIALVDMNNVNVVVGQTDCHFLEHAMLRDCR